MIRSLLLGAVAAFQVENIVLDRHLGERSFNDSCNAKGEAYYCEVKCVDEYEKCLQECTTAEDPSGCRSLCNRDQTTCFDRCPCHDKCAWGCPCGFYQCDPQCQNFEDKNPSKECADICIRQGDDHVGACMGDETEDICYEQGNKISLDCMEQCPCYSMCETCKTCDNDFGQEFCPDDITDIEKCLAVWGDEEEACMKDCDDPRRICYDNCDTATCKDQCDIDWIEREICCHKECPCHSKCPDGCPCFGDSTCGEPDVNGHDYCPDSNLDEDFLDCLADHGEISRKCIEPCREESYQCAINCNGNSICLNNCQQQEEFCKSYCPCYENCSEGCPCPGWCGELPCNTIWPDIRDCCEDKCMVKWDNCKASCGGNQDTQVCLDECLDSYVFCYDKCPCHRYCLNGCPCDNENTPDNTDCCGDIDIPSPEDEECVILWEDEIEVCRNHCSASTQQCILQCTEGDTNCRDLCLNDNAVCIGRCPCFAECPNGCPCPAFEGFPDFCPTIEPPPSKCVDDWAEEIEKCYDHCYSSNYACIRACQGDEACEQLCYWEAIKCPNDCPCHLNCPNGCPCGWAEIDCTPWYPFDSEFEHIVGTNIKPEQKIVWCEDVLPPDYIPPKYCEILWSDQLQECLDFCDTQQNNCESKCFGNAQCLEDCSNQRICCENNCPCRLNCLEGCPCNPNIDMGFCPEMITDDNCMIFWGDEAKACENDCLAIRKYCLNNCEDNDLIDDELQCYLGCMDDEDTCLKDCPCHENCKNGCGVGQCPTWDQYCKATTTVATTTMRTTTTVAQTTTVATTTAGNGGPDGPTAPPIDDIHGDTILILSDDKAMLHNWPLGSHAYFKELQHNYNDQYSKFDFNGYWVKDACSVQFGGESYIIGGAYNCALGDETCNHINVQKSVVKLSKSSCGLEIIWDGYNKKLPFDWKEHSCAAFNKRIGSSGNFETRVMVCAPTDTADDPNNDKEFIDRKCWSTRYMTTNDMLWENEPTLKNRHIKGTMTQHKGYLQILGGTGFDESCWNDKDCDSTGDTNTLEYLNQNNQNNGDGTFGVWNYGTSYPLAVEEHSMISTQDYLYVFGGLNYDESYDPWLESTRFNTKKVYKNLDPATGYQWESHGELMRGRSTHNTVYLDGQLFHIAGYAKDHTVSPPVVNGRRVEKWETTTPNAVKRETEDILYNYNSPQSFIVSEEWYAMCN